MELTLVRQNGDVLCESCMLADTPVTRVRGLLGRRTLGDDEGMLLATNAIHTSFMRFPIDAAFLDRHFVVLRIVRDLKPWRVAWQRRAHAVVELPAGALERRGVREGDQISLVRQTDTPLAHSNGNSPQPDAVRVALASSDSRFLRVAEFLLSRQRIDVQTFRDPKALIKSQEDVDVVVLDSSTSLATTARVMREVSVMKPSTRFVVVGESAPSDNGHGATQTLRVLPKWESFDRVIAEIRAPSITEQPVLD